MYVCTPCSRLDNKLYGRIKTTSVKNEREKKTIHASFLATIIVNTRVKKEKKKRKTVKIVSEKGLKKRGHAKRKRKKKEFPTNQQQKKISLILKHHIDRR